MPACLPSDDWTTKARVIGVALLLGVMAFDPKSWRRFRPSFFDLPMLGWCLVPLASGLANGPRPAGSLADAAYLAMAWGVPYLVGRLYFSDPKGLDVLARAIIVGGGHLRPVLPDRARDGAAVLPGDLRIPPVPILATRCVTWAIGRSSCSSMAISWGPGWPRRR